MVRKVYYFSTLADENSALFAIDSKYILSTDCRGAENSNRSITIGAGRREQVCLVIPVLKIGCFYDMRFKASETLSTVF